MTLLTRFGNFRLGESKQDGAGEYWILVVSPVVSIGVSRGENHRCELVVE
jgi:hypothetical protein